MHVVKSARAATDYIAAHFPTLDLDAEAITEDGAKLTLGDVIRSAVAYGIGHYQSDDSNSK